MQKDLTNYELLEILDKRIDGKLGQFEVRMNERLDQLVEITGNQFLVHGAKIDSLEQKIDNVETGLVNLSRQLENSMGNTNRRIDWIIHEMRKFKPA